MNESHINVSLTGRSAKYYAYQLGKKGLRETDGRTGTEPDSTDRQTDRQRRGQRQNGKEIETEAERVELQYTP